MGTFNTPTEVHTPDDSEVLQSERDEFLEQMGAVKVSGDENIGGKKSFTSQPPEINISAAITYGANDIMRNSDIETLIEEHTDPIDEDILGCVKTSGDENIGGKKSFTSQPPSISIPTAITYGANDIMRNSDIELLISALKVNDSSPLNSWTALTLNSNASGTIYARIDRWGYLELLVNVQRDTSISSGVEIATGVAIGYDQSYVNGLTYEFGGNDYTVRFIIKSSGSIELANEVGSVFQGYFRLYIS